VRLLVSLTGACVAGALAFAAAGLADQPVPQSLNPPPPPWQTCKAVGEGTICEGTNVESYGPIGTGIVCGSGGGAFEIFDAGTDEYSVWKKFNADGNLVRRVFHDHYTFAEFSNPLNGSAVPYTQTDVLIDILAVPGDLGSITRTMMWSSVFHLPGGGAPVFWNSGRAVQTSDGTIEFSAGRLGFVQLFAAGDSSVLEPLCAALGG